MLRDDLRALAGLAGRLRGASWFAWGVALLALAVVLLNAAANLAPPTEGDSVHQYLLVPRYWVEAGRYVQPSHIWASTLPGNMMMLSAWALLLRGSFSLATLITGFGMSLLLALGVYALARLVARPGAAALAAAAVYTMPDALYLAQSAKVDMGWAFFEVLALAAFFRWMDAPDDDHPLRWLALSGVMLGLAAGSKNQTWISVALLGGWLVLRLALRSEWRQLWRGALAFGAAVVIAALPYYLYNAVALGNPFYPVFADQFAAWFGAVPSPRSELGTEVFYPWTLGGYLTNLWNASLGHTRPGWYLGFIAGPLFLLALPVGWALGLLRGERKLWRMLGYVLVFSVMWFLVKQAVRHFLPALALLGVVSGVILSRLDRRRPPLRGVVQAGVLLVLLWNLAIGLSVLYWNGAYRVALGLETRDEFVARYHDDVVEPTFPDAETLRVLNQQVGAGGRVLAEFGGSPLYIAPDVVSGNWGDRNRLDTVTDPAQLAGMLREAGIGYILAYRAGPEDVLFAKPDFLDRYGELVYDGPRTQLYRVAGVDED